MACADAFDFCFSLMCDEAPALRGTDHGLVPLTRQEIRDVLVEQLEKPLDPEERAAWEAERWEAQNPEPPEWASAEAKPNPSAGPGVHPAVEQAQRMLAEQAAKANVIPINPGAMSERERQMAEIRAAALRSGPMP